MSDDKLIEFEESNIERLLEEFIALPDIKDKWADFIYTEYIKGMREPDDMEDR